MATVINLEEVKLAIARFLGMRRMPQGDHSDWDTYAQAAFDYAWRYYKWGWSLRVATLVNDGAGNFYLPDDFDLDGYREALGADGYAPLEMELGEWHINGQYNQSFAIEYDPAVNKYKALMGSGTSGLTLLYQIAPPELTAGAPFPSAMTIGIGGSIYAKQAENPLRADISQEWDEFHAELDRHVARSEKNKPQRYSKNLEDYYHTYTGDTR